jgi:hypothetical protein
MDRQQATVAAIIEAAKSNFFFQIYSKFRGWGLPLLYILSDHHSVYKSV